MSNKTQAGVMGSVETALRRVSTRFECEVFDHVEEARRAQQLIVHLKEQLEEEQRSVRSVDEVSIPEVPSSIRESVPERDPVVVTDPSVMRMLKAISDRQASQGDDLKRLDLMMKTLLHNRESVSSLMEAIKSIKDHIEQSATKGGETASPQQILSPSGSRTNGITDPDYSHLIQVSQVERGILDERLTGDTRQVLRAREEMRKILVRFIRDCGGECSYQDLFAMVSKTFIASRPDNYLKVLMNSPQFIRHGERFTLAQREGVRK